MDAGVASDLLHLAVAGYGRWIEMPLLQATASKRSSAPRGCGGAGPRAASPLLTDALWHRLRRGSLHPARGARNAVSHPFSAAC